MLQRSCFPLSSDVGTDVWLERHDGRGKDGSRNRRHFSKKAWAADLNKHLLNRNLLDQTVCPLILLTSVKRFFHHHPHQARRNRLQKVFISKIFYKTVRIEPEKSNHFFTSTMASSFHNPGQANCSKSLQMQLNSKIVFLPRSDGVLMQNLALCSVVDNVRKWLQCSFA